MRFAASLALLIPLFACSTGAGSAPKGFTAVFTSSSADGGAPPAFRSVRGSGAGSAWAVGEAGTVAHLSGYDWTAVPSFSTATLGGLSVLTTSQAWAVELGGARVWAWGGGAWSPLGADRADRAAAATWGVGSNDVWVAGDGIEHWDGKAWTQQVPSGMAFTSLFGTFRTDVWAVGPAGVQHYDGQVWTPQTLPAGTMPLAAVWASQLYDAWFVGMGGTILHWSGGGLTKVSAPGVMVDLTCVAGTGPTDVWIGGANGTLIHYDGGWTTYTMPAMRTITDVWRAFDADVYLVDDTGAVTRFVF